MGRKPKTAPLAPDLVAGMEVMIVREGPTKGQMGHIAEVDEKKKQVRLGEWGWMPFDAVESIATSAQSETKANGRGKVHTDVDGKPADVVLDGGAVEQPMIKPALDDLVRSLTSAKETLGDATITKKRANEDYKDAQGAVNAIVAEIVEHYGHVEQLKLPINGAGKPAGAGAVASSDLDDEEEEEDEVQGDGVVGGPY